ncbi:DUF4349 domain-containing protein [Brevibacterium salitolerans]|uniref:DUF4349 domain-containing protein n=1 Tax=Brevibacterium salitolerans TaxID=1403566 RepID=A0ABN2X5Z7_9MICO
MRRIIAPFALGLGLVLAGCASPSPSAGDARAPEYSAGSEGAAGSDGAQDSGAQGGGAQDAEPEESESDRQVVSTGDMQVITENPAEAADDIAGHGESRGGFVESRDERTDRGGEATVVVTLRVPAEAFEQLMADVSESGEVVQRSQNAEDVTGAVRDLDARIHALEISTERLEDIMAEADTSADLLEAEAALSERQGELEEYVAQRKDLEDQVSMSTLRVELRETERADDSGGLTGWLNDVRTTLLHSAGGLVVVLAAFLPWLAVLGIPAYLFVRWLRKRQRSRRRGPGSQNPGSQNQPGAATVGPDTDDEARSAAEATESLAEGEKDSTGPGPRG